MKSISQNYRYKNKKDQFGKSSIQGVHTSTNPTVSENSTFHRGSYLKERCSSNRMTVLITQVREHPCVLKTYKKQNLHRLKNSMNDYGLFEPISVIHVNNYYLILDGLSRYYCALKLDWITIDIEVFNIPESAENDFIIKCIQMVNEYVTPMYKDYKMEDTSLMSAA